MEEEKMILRIPDYYEEFCCIADKCKDSCCIGWEIDIDEDTYSYYSNMTGAFGERLQAHMYETEEGEHSFRLGQNRRCPFLNHSNLCDICTELGEEALSEVCTEYPRFSIAYGNVFQKCLSLSCEEVGRILFSRLTPVKIVERGMRMAGAADEWEQTDALAEEEIEWMSQMEKLQTEALAILTNRSLSIEERMKQYLLYFEEKSGNECVVNGVQYVDKTKTAYEFFAERFAPFTEMEILDEEWEFVKGAFAKEYHEENYVEILTAFYESEAYRQEDYEQLLVYFTFRYLMNAVYDYDCMSYAKLAVVFTLVIRDMDALRYRMHGNFTRNDRIDTARIFSKEVEHSLENIELVKEAILFDEAFRTASLLQQIEEHFTL